MSSSASGLNCLIFSTICSNEASTALVFSLVFITPKSFCLMISESVTPSLIKLTTKELRQLTAPGLVVILAL
jgi:hypothetical protein